MIRFFLEISVLLLFSFHSSNCKGLNIFPYVVQAVQQLRDQELAERAGEVPIIQSATSVCYDDLGCFDRNGTFKHLKQLPDTPENIATQFLLYTSKNREDDEVHLLDYRKPKTVSKSSIDPTKPLRFVTHGFGGKSHGEWMWDMKNAFIERDGSNVVIVDWSNGAAVPHYINSAVNAELVGAQITALYYLIKDHFGIPESKLHLVGFSLGAHVMGFVGKRMKLMRGTRPGKITGLDAAGPLFEDYGPNVHLYKDDADYVDAIHTNGDLLIYGGVGIRIPIGHVDFFPNGGVRQPGCNSTIKGFFQDLFTKSKDRQKVCNHERAVHLYIETIADSQACRFFSYKCSDFNEFLAGKCFECEGAGCGAMGYDSLGEGTHYLQTHAATPYCAKSFLLTIFFSDHTKKSYGSIVLTLVGESGSEQNISITKESDERLVPGDARVFTFVLSPQIKNVKEGRIVYTKYDGWFAKGTPTFKLGKIAVRDTKGNIVFRSCGDHVLNSDEPLHLKHGIDDCGK